MVSRSGWAIVMRLPGSGEVGRGRLGQLAGYLDNSLVNLFYSPW